MVGIALLGAGIFAREEHLPAIEACDAFELKAVYSRSQSAAKAIASEARSATVDVYYDHPATKEKSLDDLLQRKDLSAVIICLPISVQPEVIQKAITAGKHVLSEKPIAKNLATGASLLRWYQSNNDAPVWSIAENFRFIDPLKYSAEKLREIGGQVVTFRCDFYTLIQDDDKFFNTDWRKGPDFEGGFLLDGGVHFVAGLRYMLAAVGEKIQHLAAFTNLQQRKLAPVDTVHGIASTTSGSGTICISFGTEFKSRVEVEVVTTTGAVEWDGPTVKVTTKSSSGERLQQCENFQQDSGVKAEVMAFAQSIDAGKSDLRQTPSEALKDLEIIQRLLRSGEEKGSLQNIDDGQKI